MDWVSAACYLSDNRVMTGGMDGKVCLWRRGGSDCRDLYGEQGSVSVLSSLSKSTPIAASAGYDGSVIVWNCSSSSPSETKIENRRKQLPPITAFAPDSEGNLAISGSNNGLVSLWDLNQGQCLKAALGKHGTQVQKVIRDESCGEVFYTAGVDGKIGMWDTRGKLGSATGNDIGATVSATPFTSPSRAGAAPISGLVYVDETHVLASGGNDVALLDTRMNLQVVGKPMGGHKKPIASLCLGGGGLVSFSGSIDGMVIAHNLQTMQPIYGMGANKKSASFLGTTDTRLIVTGDDGHALVYSFS
ncbi:hypothetical protein TrRE_jg2007 [Triparma retinervis]|uniref:Uncharacterized protein n=1 Tax=Triparma retinervis TaxID=2557542 RepID=A0A9W7EHC2_9STRA|nr:hypothetical protein TrRE_jg2007 [Triparma retinervis]